MIHSVSANKKSFHTVTFATGLNVILADRTETSTEKDTRNGVGKSTLIKIIDFCLGSRGENGKDLLIKPLAGWAFTLEITLAGNRVKVTRSVDKHNYVVIEGGTHGWIEQPDNDQESGKRFLKVNQWRMLLGWALFDLPQPQDRLHPIPSYRSLISYMIRRGPGAYMDPFRHLPQQKTGDCQLHIAYLLGMNWEYAALWQSLKDKEQSIRAFEKAIKTGALEGVVGTEGELETRRIRLEQQTTEAKRALDSFKVHPQYESVQRDADLLTQEIHDLTNTNVTDRRLLTRYQESTREEKPPSAMSLERLYDEAGFVFSDVGKRLLNDARTFHSQIISNRRDFLEVEIKRLQQVIDERKDRIRELTDKRAEIMQVLKTHGALQEMTIMQEQFSKLQESLNSVNTNLKNMKNLKKTRRDITAAREELVQTAERDHEQRRDIWSDAVRLFNEHSQALYKSPGNLVIDVGNTGYTYKVNIERSGSEGIDKMKIFCFDLAMLHMQMKTGKGIDFIIHDTLMYDSVDARQRALAFELAHDVTNQLGGQYICTINSDMIPTEDFSEGFDFGRCVRLTLSDANPSGRLLGMSFEMPEK